MPTITAFFAAFDAKALNCTELLKSYLAGRNRIINGHRQTRGERILIFYLLTNLRKNFAYPYPILIRKYQKFSNPIAIRILMRHWLNAKQIGSGYRSVSGPSFLKIYSSVTCNMTLIYYKCAVNCTALRRNVVNLNLTLKPKLFFFHLYCSVSDFVHL